MPHAWLTRFKNRRFTITLGSGLPKLKSSRLPLLQVVTERGRRKHSTAMLSFERQTNKNWPQFGKLDAIASESDCQFSLLDEEPQELVSQFLCKIKLFLLLTKKACTSLKATFCPHNWPTLSPDPNVKRNLHKATTEKFGFINVDFLLRFVIFPLNTKNTNLQICDLCWHFAVAWSLFLHA